MLRHLSKNQQVTTDAVIPVKTGIQLFQPVPDTDVRLYDSDGVTSVDQLIGITDVEGCSQNAVILFKRFKKAYENKKINELGDTISENFSGNFYGAVTSGVVDLKAMIKIAFIPIPWRYDSGKIFFEAKPEGNLRYWRITNLRQQPQ